jgi:ornithine cyclodeaminase/alanine dehydrogenase-like protein (mu-crystallin family)
MLVLTEEQIRPLLCWDDLIPTMEAALASFSEGRVIQPVRNMITIEEGRRYLGVMPAVAEAAMGLKLVSFYPGNAGTSVPTHLATILLFRSDTGQPLAVMDGRLITEMRTAAVSAAVTQHRLTVASSLSSVAAYRLRLTWKPFRVCESSMRFASGAETQNTLAPLSTGTTRTPSQMQERRCWVRMS